MSFFSNCNTLNKLLPALKWPLSWENIPLLHLDILLASWCICVCPYRLSPAQSLRWMALPQSLDLVCENWQRRVTSLYELVDKVRTCCFHWLLHLLMPTLLFQWGQLNRCFFYNRVALVRLLLIRKVYLGLLSTFFWCRVQALDHRSRLGLGYAFRGPTLYDFMHR